MSWEQLGYEERRLAGVPQKTAGLLGPALPDGCEPLTGPVVRNQVWVVFCIVTRDA